MSTPYDRELASREVADSIARLDHAVNHDGRGSEIVNAARHVLAAWDYQGELIAAHMREEHAPHD